MTVTLTPTSQLNDWPAERARHGLRTRRVTFEDGQLTFELEPFTDYGELIQIGETPMHPSAPATPDNPAPKGLRAVLAAMLERADRQPGETQKTTLAHGLRVDLNVGIDGRTRILLARVDVYPSETEWNTTLAHLPYDPPLDTMPERFEYKRWRCLRAGWPTPGNAEHQLGSLPQPEKQ